MWHVLGKFDTEAEGGRMVKETDFEAEKKLKIKERKRKPFGRKIYSRRLFLQYFIIQQQKTLGNISVKSIEKHYDGKKKVFK